MPFNSLRDTPQGAPPAGAPAQQQAAPPPQPPAAAGPAPTGPPPPAGLPPSFPPPGRPPYMRVSCSLMPATACRLHRLHAASCCRRQPCCPCRRALLACRLGCPLTACGLPTCPPAHRPQAGASARRHPGTCLTPACHTRTAALRARHRWLGRRRPAHRSRQPRGQRGQVLRPPSAMRRRSSGGQQRLGARTSRMTAACTITTRCRGWGVCCAAQQLHLRQSRLPLRASGRSCDVSWQHFAWDCSRLWPAGHGGVLVGAAR